MSATLFFTLPTLVSCLIWHHITWRTLSAWPYCASATAAAGAVTPTFASRPAMMVRSTHVIDAGGDACHVHVIDRVVHPGFLTQMM
jgi:hypothetical protein